MERDKIISVFLFCLIFNIIIFVLFHHLQLLFDFLYTENFLLIDLWKIL